MIVGGYKVGRGAVVMHRGRFTIGCGRGGDKKRQVKVGMEGLREQSLIEGIDSGGANKLSDERCVRSRGRKTDRELIAINAPNAY